LATTDSLHSTATTTTTTTTTKAAQGIDQALLAQVRSLLHTSLSVSNTLHSNSTRLHFNNYTSTSWRTITDITHCLMIVASPYAILHHRHCSPFAQIAPKPHNCDNEPLATKHELC
jgi:hypothetical protein